MRTVARRARSKGLRRGQCLFGCSGPVPWLFMVEQSPLEVQGSWGPSPGCLISYGRPHQGGSEQQGRSAAYCAGLRRRKPAHRALGHRKEPTQEGEDCPIASTRRQGDNRAPAARRQATSKARIMRAWHQFCVGVAGGAAPPPTTMVTEVEASALLPAQQQLHRPSLCRSCNPATALRFHPL